ncbi:hypothetical protein M0812_20325 [Anaeramoeba flamelloides]|uniref:Uncharacterized protein n=1 Tax=Anaeramoeba flamelloides TaxID=1746091 RepID=A0AAV7YZQ1_9EUKA|nr:hypothetical protein M0812_20325 [Anaeramoeba flamelloides]
MTNNNFTLVDHETTKQNQNKETITKETKAFFERRLKELFNRRTDIKSNFLLDDIILLAILNKVSPKETQFLDVESKEEQKKENFQEYCTSTQKILNYSTHEIPPIINFLKQDEDAQNFLITSVEKLLKNSQNSTNDKNQESVVRKIRFFNLKSNQKKYRDYFSFKANNGQKLHKNNTVHKTEITKNKINQTKKNQIIINYGSESGSEPDSNNGSESGSEFRSESGSEGYKTKSESLTKKKRIELNIENEFEFVLKGGGNELKKKKQMLAKKEIEITSDDYEKAIKNIKSLTALNRKNSDWEIIIKNPNRNIFKYNNLNKPKQNKEFNNEEKIFHNFLSLKLETESILFGKLNEETYLQTIKKLAKKNLLDLNANNTENFQKLNTIQNFDNNWIDIDRFNEIEIKKFFVNLIKFHPFLITKTYENFNLKNKDQDQDGNKKSSIKNGLDVESEILNKTINSFNASYEMALRLSRIDKNQFRIFIFDSTKTKMRTEGVLIFNKKKLIVKSQNKKKLFQSKWNDNLDFRINVTEKKQFLLLKKISKKIRKKKNNNNKVLFHTHNYHDNHNHNNDRGNIHGNGDSGDDGKIQKTIILHQKNKYQILKIQTTQNNQRNLLSFLFLIYKNKQPQIGVNPNVKEINLNGLNQLIIPPFENPKQKKFKKYLIFPSIQLKSKKDNTKKIIQEKNMKQLIKKSYHQKMVIFLLHIVVKKKIPFEPASLIIEHSSLKLYIQNIKIHSIKLNSILNIQIVKNNANLLKINLINNLDFPLLYIKSIVDRNFIIRAILYFRKKAKKKK